MRKIFTQIAAIVLLISLSGKMLYAQTAAVSGKIMDENSKPLSFVTVQLEGTAMGAQSDNDGNYTIPSVAPGNYNLVASYVGYKKFSQAITVANASLTVDILFHTDAANLNEVVVIGYGTAKKSDLTGAVTSIDEKDFNTGDIQTPEQLIEGKAAGVVVTPGDGSPGSAATIRIRGLSSFNATNNPLYVIDGVPIDVDLSIPGNADPLSLINPNDIENITILKDASATAIYGSRASNGVIIVTTKRGTAGKFKVNFNSLESIEMVQNTVSVLSPSQFRSIVDSFGTSAQKALLGKANTNWQNQIYRLAPATDDNISFSGGIKDLPYRLSLEYSDQDGVMLTNYMQRGVVDLTASKNFLHNTLSITINEKGSIQANRFPGPSGYGPGGAVGFDPTQPVTTGSPRYGGYFEWLNSSGEPASLAPFNPVGQINETVNKSTVYRSIGNIQIDYKIPYITGLSANLNTGYDVSEGKGTVNIPDSAASNYVNSNYVSTIKKDSIYKYARGLMTQYDQTNQNDVLDFTLNYKKEIKSIKSVFDVTGGYSYANFLTTAPAYYSYYQNGDSIPKSKPQYPTYSENTLISFFGRFNYAFNDEFLLTGTLRDDGSSRFAPADRWGVFPSVALAWRLTQESFLKNSKVLSDLKIRVGDGATGNQDGIGDYPYQSQYYYSNASATYEFGNQFYPTLRPSAVDPNIKWESTATQNVAVDYGFFNNRIFGSIDFYYKKTTNLIGTIFVPEGTNFSNEVQTNVGSMQNQGVEFSFNTIPVSTKDITFEIDYNITYNENKVLSLSKTSTDTSEYLEGGIQGGIGSTVQIIKAGYPAYSFFVYQQYYNNGVPVEGEYYYLIDGKPVVVGEGASAHDSLTKKPTSANLYISNKSPFPKTTMGLTPIFRYKRWAIQGVLRGSFGNYVYNNVASAATRNNILIEPTSLNNVSTNYLSTNFVTPQYLSDYYVQNASFVKIDNITLSYNVGKILKGKALLKLSATVQNVATFTPYKGLDPEIYGGIDNNIYPRPRIFSIGLNVQI